MATHRLVELVDRLFAVLEVLLHHAQLPEVRLDELGVSVHVVELLQLLLGARQELDDVVHRVVHFPQRHQGRLQVLLKTGEPKIIIC